LEEGEMVNADTDTMAAVADACKQEWESIESMMDHDNKHVDIQWNWYVTKKKKHWSRLVPTLDGDLEFVNQRLVIDGAPVMFKSGTQRIVALSVCATPASLAPRICSTPSMSSNLWD
jgi:hypothetical protein